MITSRMSPSSKCATKVRIAWRSGGGVWITLKSRMPSIAMCSVRGIGVAVRVSTSTSLRRRLMRSLSATPKRCSSSTISRPSRGNSTSLLEQAMGPDHDIDHAVPDVHRPPCSRARCENARPSRSAPGSRRSDCASCSSAAPRAPWSAPVLATCRPSITAINAARSATSVLPKPASPQISRSIGLTRHIANHFVDRGLLVGRLLELEALGEFLVVRARMGEGVALDHLARGIDVEQLGGHREHRLAWCAA